MNSIYNKGHLNNSVNSRVSNYAEKIRCDDLVWQENYGAQWHGFLVSIWGDYYWRFVRTGVQGGSGCAPNPPSFSRRFCIFSFWFMDGLWWMLPHNFCCYLPWPIHDQIALVKFWSHFTKRFASCPETVVQWSWQFFASPLSIFCSGIHYYNDPQFPSFGF